MFILLNGSLMFLTMQLFIYYLLCLAPEVIMPPCKVPISGLCPLPLLLKLHLCFKCVNFNITCCLFHVTCHLKTSICLN